MIKRILLCALISMIITACRSTPHPVEIQEPVSAEGGSSKSTAPAPAQAAKTAIPWDLSSLVPISRGTLSKITQVDVLEGHEGFLVFLSFNPQGTELASSSEDGTVRLWNVSSGMEIATFPHGRESMGVSFNPDGTLLASGGTDNIVRLWDVASGAMLQAFEGHAWGIRDVVFGPDGQYIASASVDHTVRVWEPGKDTEVAVFYGHNSDVLALAFHPGGRLLASGSPDKSVRVWDLQQESQVRVLEGNKDGVLDVSFSPDGTILAACGGGPVAQDNTTRLWDTSNWEMTAELTGHNSPVVACEFSNQGDILISRAEAGELFFWDIPSGKLLATFEAPRSPTPAMAISPDDRLLALGGMDGRIYLYGIP